MAARTHLDNAQHALLDDVAKQIIAQLQEDGRRPYATIGRAVGLSEAAVRQRVQRLIDAGVMQIVAVTDPLQLGLGRQAMVGVKTTGNLEAIADQIMSTLEMSSSGPLQSSTFIPSVDCPASFNKLR